MSKYMLIYPYELVLHNRRGPYLTILRGSVTAFRIVENSDDAPHVVVCETSGQKTKLAGSDLSREPWIYDIVEPRRNAEETETKLDSWLRAGHFNCSNTHVAFSAT